MQSFMKRLAGPESAVSPAAALAQAIRADGQGVAGSQRLNKAVDGYKDTMGWAAANDKERYLLAKNVYKHAKQLGIAKEDAKTSVFGLLPVSRERLAKEEAKKAALKALPNLEKGLAELKLQGEGQRATIAALESEKGTAVDELSVLKSSLRTAVQDELARAMAPRMEEFEAAKSAFTVQQASFGDQQAALQKSIAELNDAQQKLAAKVSEFEAEKADFATEKADFVDEVAAYDSMKAKLEGEYAKAAQLDRSIKVDGRVFLLDASNLKERGGPYLNAIFDPSFNLPTNADGSYSLVRNVSADEFTFIADFVDRGEDALPRPLTSDMAGRLTRSANLLEMPQFEAAVKKAADPSLADIYKTNREMLNTMQELLTFQKASNQTQANVVQYLHSIDWKAKKQW